MSEQNSHEHHKQHYRKAGGLDRYLKLILNQTYSDKQITFRKSVER